MGMTQIRIQKDKIKSTESFKKLSPIQQKLALKRTNVLKIEHALNVIQNRGYKFWYTNSKYSYNNTMLIDDLVMQSEVNNT